MEQYYDKIAFSDWTNSLSKTPMLKARRPEYETWTAGIHGKNNVTCIDCHMPKVQNAEGKLYTDHKIGNPFDNFTQTCANWGLPRTKLPCKKWSRNVSSRLTT